MVRLLRSSAAAAALVCALPLPFARSAGGYAVFGDVASSTASSAPTDRCAALPKEPPGTELVEITGPGCVGAHAGQPAIPGNTSDPVAVSDARHNYITFFSKDEPHQVLALRYDGTTCSPPVRVNPEPGDDRSHDAPSIFTDGLGYLYATYHGHHHRRGAAPALRRTVRPHDLGAWGAEERARLWNSSEVSGFQVLDGSVVLVGSNLQTRIDVIEPGGSYRWPAARQVVAQDATPGGSACGSRGNRFTKAVVEPGWRLPDGQQVLLAVWGWGGGWPDDKRPDWLCPDIRGYHTDSHELFFAFSEDGGVTWQDKDRKVRVTAPLCRTDRECSRPGSGIVHNDPRFRLTSTRQKQYRAVWGDDDGTIYVAFERSEWCDGGAPCNVRNASKPGALMMLRFRLSGPVQERLVDPARHTYTAGIRKAGGILYVWSKLWGGPVVEYRSQDEGNTWAATALVERAVRVQGLTRIPCLDSMRLLISAAGDPRRLFYFRRSF